MASKKTSRKHLKRNASKMSSPKLGYSSQLATRWQDAIKGISMRYTYTVGWDEETGEFVGSCTEFPIAKVYRGTRVDAFVGVVEAVWEMISQLVCRDHTMPPRPHHAPCAIYDELEKKLLLDLARDPENWDPEQPIVSE